MLRLYDTATREVRTFRPVTPGRASIYICGLTVQGPPHLGHVRNWVTTDILRRWLEHRGLAVTLVRNVTDIDDKILLRSARDGEPWWSLAFRNERMCVDAERRLGCLPVSYEPRATGHIPEMVELIHRLIERGHAYTAEGDVYFDVRSHSGYGELSRQRVAEMQPAGDSAGDAHKRDPRDFALWKAVKPGEPSWATPWGRGRPGWHLECSAMATKYLGPRFDIHGGGLDLLFPHHENELAQSVAAGDGFAGWWMHNGLLTMAGEKMSKSLGNTLSVHSVVTRWRPVEVRYYLGAAHYRSTMEYSPAAIGDAAAAYRRIETYVKRAQWRYGPPAPVAVPHDFAAAIENDLGVPAALGVLHEAVRTGNSALDADSAEGGAIAAQVAVMTEVLGIHPGQWASASTSESTDAIEALVDFVLELRAQARSRRDYPTSDLIRERLATAGIRIEDTPTGVRWIRSSKQLPA